MRLEQGAFCCNASDESDLLLVVRLPGATGTAVKKEPAINIFSVVKSLRDQRPGMVQSKASLASRSCLADVLIVAMQQQYAFCSLFLDHCIQTHKFGL